MPKFKGPTFKSYVGDDKSQQKQSNESAELHDKPVRHFEVESSPNRLKKYGKKVLTLSRQVSIVLGLNYYYYSLLILFSLKQANSNTNRTTTQQIGDWSNINDALSRLSNIGWNDELTNLSVDEMLSKITSVVGNKICL